MPLHPNPLSKQPPSAHPAGESDVYLLPTLAAIQLRAWLTVPMYRDVLYAGPPSTHPGIVQASVERHRKALLEDQSYQFTSVVGCEEPEVGEPWVVVGFVKFRVVGAEWGGGGDGEGGEGGGGDVVKQEETRTWPEGTHVPFVDWLWPKLMDARRRWGEKLREYVFVDILAVEPGWQRRGVGGMCMQEVCAEADRRGWPCWLEGTQEGRGLYEKWGFVVQEEIWVDLSRWEGGGDQGERWRGDEAKEGVGEGWYRLVIMVRPAKGQA